MAFLGSGIDVIYPPENLELYKRIQDSRKPYYLNSPSEEGQIEELFL